ncbi:hypothetical protein A0H81_03597 [Grifola frondosa]|uniref:Uncharacterized protein n=1 Tax=Grifola frondosa TaxID=5627 RepID=A0A1C7MIZ8_GRIFR|nr:hypothetical protein A0H81_03597 [Grifola frondosa]
MATEFLSAYRTVVREVQKAAEDPQRFGYDIQNVVTFMQSQRTHKALLERYNPLHDLSTDQRIQATARRVGLDMPLTAKRDEDK